MVENSTGGVGGKADMGRRSQPFSLLRSFSILSFLSLSAVSVCSALVLSWFLETHLLQREGVVMMQLVQSMADAEGAAGYFDKPDDSAVIERFARQIVNTPDGVRANLYDQKGKIVWSSEPLLIDENLENEDVEASLAGNLSVEIGSVEEEKKAEHIHWPPGIDKFVEYYIPVRSGEGSVVGVVELYKTPQALIDMIRDGTRLIWVGALLGGAFVYLVQFWIVRRGAALIRRQQAALIDTEKMAVMGDIAAAVVHGVRNPLAAIRSCSELIRDDPTDGARELSQDIIAEVDLLERSVRDLLVISSLRPDAERNADIASVVDRAVADAARRLKRAGIAIDVELPPSLPPVRGNPELLAKVVSTLIANAHEAMPSGGRITVAAELQGRDLAVSVRDTGTGLSKTASAPEKGEFKPFATGKRTGLGLGLFLAQRLLDRCGGTLALENAATGGATATLRLQCAS